MRKCLNKSTKFGICSNAWRKRSVLILKIEVWHSLSHIFVLHTLNVRLLTCSLYLYLSLNNVRSSASTSQNAIAQPEQRKGNKEKQPVRWHLKNDMMASLCYLFLFSSLSLSLLARKLSLIHSNQKHSLTADEPRRTIGWKGICAFMGGTEAQFGKKKNLCSQFLLG